MRILPLALVACAGAPDAFDAWHGAFRIEQLTHGIEGCDGPTEPYEPVQPWLFTAVVDGDPPLSSLYWCRDAEACDSAPFATVELERITKQVLSGTYAEAGMIGDTLCSAYWAGVEAEQDGGRVTLTFSTARAEVEVTDVAECEEVALDLIGAACDDVLRFEGERDP